MDPNANLTEQLRLIGLLRDNPDPEDAQEWAYELCNLVEALDHWLLKGGFLPSRWTRLHPPVEEIK